tara:strand:- start:393 stop:662 length:270 start_codon:yes stop_codon:yes gene_type:complete
VGQATTTTSGHTKTDFRHRMGNEGAHYFDHTRLYEQLKMFNCFDIDDEDNLATDRAYYLSYRIKRNIRKIGKSSKKLVLKLKSVLQNSR